MVHHKMERNDDEDDGMRWYLSHLLSLFRPRTISKKIIICRDYRASTPEHRTVSTTLHSIKLHSKEDDKNIYDDDQDEDERSRVATHNISVDDCCVEMELGVET